MADMPTGTPYGYLVGRFGGLVNDSDDEGDAPDLDTNLTGKVEVTASITSVGHIPTKRTIFVKPLSVKVYDASFRIKLIATNDPDLNIQDWHYTASVTIDGYGTIGPIRFQLADKEEKDFYDILGVNPQPGVITQFVEGPAGPANTLSVGSVTKAIDAAATITGKAPNQILNLQLPQGDPGIDKSIFSGKDVTLINPDDGGVQHFDFTKDLMVSIKNPGRVSFIMTVSGWEHITWDNVVIYGDPLVVGNVWCSCVWDASANKWAVFVDSATRKNDAGNTLPEFEYKPDQVLTEKDAGIKLVVNPEEFVLKDFRLLNNWYDTTGYHYVPQNALNILNVEQPVIVEQNVKPYNTIEEMDSRNFTGLPWQVSLVASRKFVTDNFAPLGQKYDFATNTYSRPQVPFHYLPSLTQFITQEVPSTSIPHTVGVVTLDGFGPAAFGTNDMSALPVPFFVSLADSPHPFVRNAPSLAYHRVQKKLLLWHPEDAVWTNLDGTPFVETATSTNSSTTGTS